jgi:hypothetical protein
MTLIRVSVTRGVTLELLGSERNMDLTKDQADVLGNLVDAALASLALLVSSLVTRVCPDGVGE